MKQFECMKRKYSANMCSNCGKRSRRFPRLWKVWAPWKKRGICLEDITPEEDDYLTEEEFNYKYSKSQHARSARSNPVEQPLSVEDISAYLMTPERLRPQFGPLRREPTSKRAPGTIECIESRKQITNYMKNDLVFAKRVDVVLRQTDQFSVKDPKISAIRREISSLVFGSEIRNLVDAREWLRNHYRKLVRQENRKIRDPRR
jgi:hypothetical protein